MTRSAIESRGFLMYPHLTFLLQLESGQPSIIRDLRCVTNRPSRQLDMTCEALRATKCEPQEKRPAEDVPSFSRNQVFAQILDRDYDDIEKDLFGSSAVDCLDIARESAAAPPQGNVFLKGSQHISAILRRFKGIYSIL